ncbi:MAG: hypothetical protein ABEJ93_03625 [Candidatus Nanohalobium sp.]
MGAESTAGSVETSKNRDVSPDYSPRDSLYYDSQEVRLYREDGEIYIQVEQGDYGPWMPCAEGLTAGALLEKAGRESLRLGEVFEYLE